jgi:hypothetical protein
VTPQLAVGHQAQEVRLDAGGARPLLEVTAQAAVAHEDKARRLLDPPLTITRRADHNDPLQAFGRVALVGPRYPAEGNVFGRLVSEPQRSAIAPTSAISRATNAERS